MHFDPARTDVRHDLFGGRGSVKVQVMGNAPLPPPFTVALLCELAPGGAVGAHVQASDSEIILALSGEAVIYVNGQPNAVTPGGCVGLPLGAQLEIDNASMNIPFVYAIVKANPSNT